MLILTVHNDRTGTEDVGNYDYNVYINKHIIASGRIEGFKRKYGWKQLIGEIIRDEKFGEELK